AVGGVGGGDGGLGLIEEHRAAFEVVPLHRAGVPVSGDGDRLEGGAVVEGPGAVAAAGQHHEARRACAGERRAGDVEAIDGGAAVEVAAPLQEVVPGGGGVLGVGQHEG